MQPLWECGTLGRGMSTKVVRKVQRRWKEKPTMEEKTSTLSRRQRDAYVCDKSTEDGPRFQCFFESRHGFMLERIRRRREQRCSLLDKAKKLRLECNQVCGEFETTLNSFPGKGIVDTGCAKMMMDQILFNSIFSPEFQRTSIPLRKCERRTGSGLETTRLECHSGSAAIPMNIGGQVCVRR